jgi:alanine racemase
MSLSRRAFLGAATLAATPTVLRGLEAEAFPPADTATIAPDRFDPWVEVIPDHISLGVREVLRLSGNRPVLAVVKNNGYGLDIGTVGKILQADPGITGMAVVKAEEALKLRAAGVRKPILLMGLFSNEAGRELVEAGVDLAAFTPDAAERILPLARATGRSVGIHFYLDTGMGRMGMDFREALPWMEELNRHPEIQVRGTFTELGEDSDFDHEQLGRFLDVTGRAREAGVAVGLRHAASSNGVFHLPEGHLDMVRPGISLFGAYPSRPEEEREMADLKAAVRLKARVVRIALIRPGEGVGYGRPWIADEPTWVATLPVGHADGYPREAVQGAEVLIKDALYPVIGGVSASHCIARIGAHPSVEVGDVVTFLGPDKPALEPNRMAENLGVSVYDILMHLNPLLPRVTVNG